MPTYLRPGVYVEQLWTAYHPFSNAMPRAAGSAAPGPPIRVTRSRWLPAASVMAILGFASRGPVGTPQPVTSWKQFEASFGDYLPDTCLGNAVRGFFANGGQRCYVVRLNGADDAERVTAASATLRAVDDARACLEVRARDAGPAGNRLAVEVLSPTTGDAQQFSLVVSEDGEAVELLENMRLAGGPRFAPEYAAEVSTRVDIHVLESTAQPALGTVTRLTGGALSTPSEEITDVFGDLHTDTTAGLRGLERISDIDTVCAPDLMSAYAHGWIDLETVEALQMGLIAHCEQVLGRIAILDSPPAFTPQQIHEWRRDRTMWDTSHAALYYPWIKVFDPGAGRNVYTPPSGHISGIYARSALVKGIHSTVANEEIVGAVETEYPLSLNEIDILNPLGINVIAVGGGSTPTLLGGRTLSSDPEWRFVGTRRIADFFLRNASSAMRWVLYEPNDATLWARIVDELSGLCDLLLRAGVLSGDSAEDAYQIRCDEETNLAESQDSKLVMADCDVFLAGGPQLSFRLVFASV